MAGLSFEVDGRPVEVADDGSSLLDVLREQLGVRSVKDGCSPQGQCGCCTVLVDGQARVACVTPARRVRGRAITTLDGLPEAERAAWGEAFCATGASQCGFCTPGIILRLHALRAKGAPADDESAVGQALLAHLCRCTGWRTIYDAYRAHETAVAAPSLNPDGRPAANAVQRPGSPTPTTPPDLTTAAPSLIRNGRPATETDQRRSSPTLAAERSLGAAGRRASIEGRSPQVVGPEVALGQGGFADDTAPPGALVAVPDGAGGWALGASLAEARAASGKVQGRRTTTEPTPPLDLPPGEWAATLRTGWVEPAYLELDASWCVPGGEPASPLANGGAFGGKTSSVAAKAAAELAQRHGRAVRVVLAREDTVRLGPKRPPVAGGVDPEGRGILRVVRTPGIAEAIHAVAPDLVVEEVDVPGPPTSADLRAAGWAEALLLLSTVRGPGPIAAPNRAMATADVQTGPDPAIHVRVRCGDPLDEVVLRSYCIGAAHMALGWVTSEGLAVDPDGTIHDLTIRSFGIVRAVDMPSVSVTIEPDDNAPVNGSDAVFAAVAAAVWRAQGHPTDLPTGRPLKQ